MQGTKTKKCQKQNVLKAMCGMAGTLRTDSETGLDGKMRWLGRGVGGVWKGVCLALPERVREPRHTLACQFHVQWQKVIHLVIFYLYMFSPPLPSPPSCCPVPWPILSAYLFWTDNATRQRRQFSIALSRIPFMPFPLPSLLPLALSPCTN